MSGAAAIFRSRAAILEPVANVYVELTREFNREQPLAALSSGQAVVHYRLAIMSKDGDWIVRETPEACARVLAALASRGACSQDP